jgi:transposase-like protein
MKPTVKCPFCHNEVTIGEKFMDAEEYICFQCKKIFQRNFIKSKEDKKESVKLKIDIQKEKKSNQKREIEIANEEKITRLEQKALFVMNNKLEDINKATNIKNKKQEETRQ